MADLAEQVHVILIFAKSVSSVIINFVRLLVCAVNEVSIAYHLQLRVNH